MKWYLLCWLSWAILLCCIPRPDVGYFRSHPYVVSTATFDPNLPVTILGRNYTGIRITRSQGSFDPVQTVYETSMYCNGRKNAQFENHYRLLSVPEYQRRSSPHITDNGKTMDVKFSPTLSERWIYDYEVVVAAPGRCCYVQDDAKVRLSFTNCPSKTVAEEEIYSQMLLDHHVSRLAAFLVPFFFYHLLWN